VGIIATGGICPLTPLENALLHAAGQAGYSGGFIEHWVQRLIYPPGLERWHQGVIAAVLLAVNVAVYSHRFGGAGLAARWLRAACSRLRKASSRLRDVGTR
jgi:hypothetical protein